MRELGDMNTDANGTHFISLLATELHYSPQNVTILLGYVTCKVKTIKYMVRRDALIRYCDSKAKVGSLLSMLSIN